MDEFELEQLRQHPVWISILDHYQHLSIEMKERVADFDGWIPRILELAGIPTEELSGLHGKLIAYGFLKFDLAGRDAGVRYQLTPLGKQGLNRSLLGDSENGELHIAEEFETVEVGS